MPFRLLALCKAVQELSAENERLQLIVDGKTFVTQELSSPAELAKERDELRDALYKLTDYTYDYAIPGGDGKLQALRAHASAVMAMLLPSPPQEAGEAVKAITQTKAQELALLRTIVKPGNICQVQSNEAFIDCCYVINWNYTKRKLAEIRKKYAALAKDGAK